MNSSLKHSLLLAKTFMENARKILVFVSIAVFVFAILVLFTPLFKFFFPTKAIYLDSLTITLNSDSVLKPTTMKLFISFGFFVGGIFFVLILFIFKLIEEMIDSALQSSPFNSTVIKNLKKISFLIILVGIILNVIHLISAARIYNIINFDVLFNKDVVNKVDFTYDISFTFIFIAEFINLLAKIFEYGTELQTLSDETL